MRFTQRQLLGCIIFGLNFPHPKGQSILQTHHYPFKDKVLVSMAVLQIITGIPIENVFIFSS